LKKILYMTPSAPVLREQMLRWVPEGFVLEFALQTDQDYHQALLEDADYVFIAGSRIGRYLMQHAPRLKMIQKWGIGVDKIDVEAAKDLGIHVYITSGANALQVAEHTLLLMLATLRKLTYAQKAMRAQQWVNAELRTTCMQLTGKTVGLYGFGNIAQQVAKQLRGFDVELIYHSRRRAAPEIEQQCAARYVDSETLFSQSDVLSLHAPYNAQTFEMINRSTLSLMKPSAVLINTARGELIKDVDLVDALQNGRLFGAGIDVFIQEPPPVDHPFFALDNVVMTPHSGASVQEVVDRVIEHGFNNIHLFDQGLPIDPADRIV
jgi:D-3-phosphoglycerate dehydrogenase